MTTLRTVELLGLPGCGKSTVQRTMAIQGTTTVTDWRGLRRWLGIPITAQLVLRAPLLTVGCYLAVGTRRSVNRIHLRRVPSVLRRYTLVKHFEDSVTVVDEGPVHSLFITLYGTRPTAVSRPLLKWVLRGLARRVNYYVYLDLDKEDCIENFRRPGRTSVRFNESSSTAAIEDFRRDGTYAEVLDALRRVADKKLIVVSSVPDACAAIAALQVRRDGDSNQKQ